MNWRRGLLRLWVVFSLVWLLGCGVWGLSQRHAGIGAKFPVTDPNGLKFVVTAPVGATKADVLYFVRNSDVVKMRQADCGKQHSVSCRREIPVQMPGVIEDVVRVLVFSIAVPLIVLILGLIFGWVILGFQKPIVPPT